jgi:hypothetical protein
MRTVSIAPSLVILLFVDARLTCTTFSHKRSMIEAREADHREKLGKPQRSSREQVTGLRFLILIAPYLRERDGPVRLQQDGCRTEQQSEQ